MIKVLVVAGLALAGSVLFLEFVLADGDTAPPHLASLDFKPKTINTECAPTVTFTARITDDLSGVTDGIIGGVGGSPTQIRFEAPTSSQFIDILFETPKNLVSGDALDGVYANTATWPRFSETGVWSAQYMLLVDDVGNFQFMDRGQLLARGFPVDLAVGDTGTCYRVHLPVVSN
jgi:hypothetical protein